MHGRLKVRSTEEQKEAKRKEREKKLEKYNLATGRIFEKRRNGELDEEMMQLTEDILNANSDMLTLWNIRREVFISLKKEKDADYLEQATKSELYFLQNCLQYNPKSYGCWNHRCWIMDNMPGADWQRELKLCNKFLEYDERNFHCWDYRRFVVKRAAVANDAEFKFTTKKIETNFSNFSSWHYRSRLLPLVHSDPANTRGVTQDALQHEFELVQNAVFTDPSDQSAWFYHRWLLGKGSQTQAVSSFCLDRRSGDCFVVLNQCDSVCDVTVSAQEVELDVAWKGGTDQRHNRLWIGKIAGAKELTNITITYNGTTIAAHDNGGNTAAYRQKPTFNHELHGSTRELLEQELSNCTQLYELEPDNKWVLLTLLSLMRALDPLLHEQKTLDYVTKLRSADLGRKRYYDDLRSRFLIENYLLRHDDVRVVDLSGMGLSALYHTDHMTLTEDLNLSNNELHSLADSHFLRRLRMLRTEGNPLSSAGQCNISALEQRCVQNTAEAQ